MCKVILIPAACGQTALDVGLLEQNANTMYEQGYELVQVYQTSSRGCGGPKSAAVMIFRRRTA